MKDEKHSNSSFSLHPSSLFPRVGLVQKIQNRLARGALSQEAPEHVLLKVRKDAVHRRQMLLRLILGTQEQKDAVNGLMIQCGKVDARAASPDSAGHPGHLGMLHMRDGHAFAEAC